MSYEPIKTSAPRRYLSLSDEEVFFRVEQLMNNREIYRDPYLTVEALATEIGISGNVLSRVINTFTGTNFQAWLGVYRIAAAARLAAENEGGKLKIIELAKLAGFSSRTSFFRVCQRVTGNSPSVLMGKAKKTDQTEK